MTNSMALKQMMKRPLSLAVVATFAALCGSSPGWAVPLLGAAESFAVLGGSGVTNAHVAGNADTTIFGNVGVYPAPQTTITGFPPAVVTGGAIHGPDGVSQAAQAAATTARGTLAGLACPALNHLAATVGNLVLTPGVYCFASTALLTGNLTLDAEGDSNALFVFQIPTSLTTGSGATVTVTDGNSNTELYWQVGVTATLGTDTLFAGNILALTSVVLDPRAQILCGRAFAEVENVTLIDNQISNNCGEENFNIGTGPGRTDFGSNGFSGSGTGEAVVAEPSTLVMLGLGLASLFGFARRR